MRALVYQGPGLIEIEERPMPTIQSPTDAIGSIPSCSPGRTLGHEGVGVIDTLGPAISNMELGDRVLIGSITACGKCSLCRRGTNSHCESGGWLLGNIIDGLHADYVRVPHADFSLYRLPPEVSSLAAVSLSDAFPTAYEGGVINGGVRPMSSVAIVGSGPIALATVILTRALYPSTSILVVGRGKPRLRVAEELGANYTLSINETGTLPADRARSLNLGADFDVVVEAVGSPESIGLAQRLAGVGASIATLSYFQSKCDLHLDLLWNKNICLKTQLTNGSSIPELLRLTVLSYINPGSIISHVFSFSDVKQAYEKFQAGSKAGVLKVAILL